MAQPTPRRTAPRPPAPGSVPNTRRRRQVVRQRRAGCAPDARRRRLAATGSPPEARRRRAGCAPALPGGVPQAHRRRLAARRIRSNVADRQHFMLADRHVAAPPPRHARGTPVAAVDLGIVEMYTSRRSPYRQHGSAATSDVPPFLRRQRHPAQDIFRGRCRRRCRRPRSGHTHTDTRAHTHARTHIQALANANTSAECDPVLRLVASIDQPHT